MRRCEKCFSNKWKFEKQEDWIQALCQVCDNEVIFEAKNSSKERMFPGSECRKCKFKVVLCTHKPNWKPKIGIKYYFKSWLKCPNCKTFYMIDSEKVYL